MPCAEPSEPCPQATRWIARQAGCSMLAQGRTVTLTKQLYMLAHCPKPYLVCSRLPSASGSVSSGAAGASCGMRGCNQDTSRPMQGVGAGESRKRHARRTGADVQYP